MNWNQAGTLPNGTVPVVDGLPVLVASTVIPSIRTLVADSRPSTPSCKKYRLFKTVSEVKRVLFKYLVNLKMVYFSLLK
jgi:hypothetical protein